MPCLLRLLHSLLHDIARFELAILSVSLVLNSHFSVFHAPLHLVEVTTITCSCSASASLEEINHVNKLLLRMSFRAGLIFAGAANYDGLILLKVSAAPCQWWWPSEVRRDVVIARTLYAKQCRQACLFAMRGKAVTPHSNRGVISRIVSHE